MKRKCGSFAEPVRRNVRVVVNSHNGVNLALLLTPRDAESLARQLLESAREVYLDYGPNLDQ